MENMRVIIVILVHTIAVIICGVGRIQSQQNVFGFRENRLNLLVNGLNFRQKRHK